MKTLQIALVWIFYCVILYVPWWFLCPETFWQRMFAAIIELPIAVILAVFAGAATTVILEDEKPKETAQKTSGKPWLR